MRIIKISHGENFFTSSEYEQILKNNLACVHQDTPSKGRSVTTQFNLFINADVGDILYICNSNKKIDIIGVFMDNRPLFFNENHKENNWVSREFLVLFKAKNPEKFDKENNKWWMPRNNSTCIEIPEVEFNLFENEILNPVFEQSFDFLLQKRHEALKSIKFDLEKAEQFQNHFSKCFKEEKYLLETVNTLPVLELKKQQYDYYNRKYLNYQPVVKLRSQLINELINNVKLSNEVINQQKEIITQDFEKNVFQSWGSNFRVLFPLIYDEYRTKVNLYFKTIIERLQNDLNLKNITKYNFVDYDGAQNQGREDLWFAIYNNSHKNQKSAKQLFLRFGSKIQFGLKYLRNPESDKLNFIEKFDYEFILNEFKNFKEQIINDNINQNQKQFEMIELLEYKKQIILQGPPGTGKTKLAKEIAEEFIKSNTINSKTIVTKQLTKDFIKSTLKINQKIESKSKIPFEVVSLDDNVVILKSDVSQPWRPSYNKIIESFQGKLWEIKGRTGGFKPYEDAVAKYFYDNHLNSIHEVEKNIENINEYICLVQFHPSYTYEDFVRGIVAKTNEESDGIIYLAENKTLGILAENALNDYDNKYVLIIDEINRANLSSVLGELIYALEYRGEAVESMYAVDDDNQLILPPNLYIIGTMNTADRSVGHIDYAIRRRFAFVDVLPENLKEKQGLENFHEVLFLEVEKLFKEHTSPEFEVHDVQLGHSYFIDKSEEENGAGMDIRFKYEIKPILLEYVKDGVLIEKGKDIKKEIEDLKTLL